MTTPPPVPYVAEPPAHYRVLPPLVVDCSMLAGRLFQEEWKQQAGDTIAGKTLHAPHLLVNEITSVALKKHKQGMAEIARDGLAPSRCCRAHCTRCSPRKCSNWPCATS